MYKHILIPTDGSATAAKAVAAGIDHARETGARVTLFTAVPEYQLPGEAELMAGRYVSPAEHDRRSKEKAESVLAPALAYARRAGVEFSADHAQSGQPSRAIIDAARRNGCDAIFMASHARRGLARLLKGSQTIDVLTHSDIPTMVVR